MVEKITTIGIIEKLRNGEKVKCTECGKGFYVPFGDYKTSTRFTCDVCKAKININ